MYYMSLIVFIHSTLRVFNKPIIDVSFLFVLLFFILFWIVTHKKCIPVFEELMKRQFNPLILKHPFSI